MSNLFEISRSGLKAAQQSLRVTSNNIANANTEGYSRQRAELRPVANNVPERIKTGYGVEVTRIERIRDELADKQIFRQSNDLNSFMEQSKVFAQLESVMITDLGDSLDLTVSGLFNAFSELSNAPQDMALRRNVLNKADALADQFRTIHSDVGSITEQTVEAGEGMLNRVNVILQNLHDINETVYNAYATNSSNNEVKDEQIRLLTELSEMVDADITFSEAGTATVQLGGTVLLNDSFVATLRAESSAAGNFFNVRSEATRNIDIQGGKLGGIIQMVEQEIPSIKNSLDELVSSIVTEVNTLHATGYGILDGNQRVFFNSSGLTADSMEVNGLIRENVGHIAASSAPGESGNNENAILISKLRDQNVLNGRSIIESSIRLMSEPGRAMNDLDSKMSTKESVINMLRSQQDAVSGVDMDEELSNLIKFQNSYQASARALRTAQEMMDTLISII